MKSEIRMNVYCKMYVHEFYLKYLQKFCCIRYHNAHFINAASFKITFVYFTV